MIEINGVALLTQSLAFIILIWVIAKFAFRPLASVIDARRQEIEGTLEQVAADRRAMEQSRSEYEQRLAGIEAEAREHIAQAVRQAQEEAAAILEKARTESVAHRERALAEIDQERRKAIAQIRSEMADLAVVAASKVLEREINPTVHRELIGRFIDQVGAAT